MPTNIVINVVTNGLAIGEESSFSRRAYVRVVHNVSSKYKRSTTSEQISFSNEDLKEKKPHMMRSW